jgi:hypothetical protein
MNRKTVSITIEEYAELEHLRNYKRINELDFLIRQNFKYSVYILKIPILKDVHLDNHYIFFLFVFFF